jgi:TolA-binding protein
MLFGRKKRPEDLNLVPLEKIRKRLEGKETAETVAPTEISPQSSGDLFSSFSSAAETSPLSTPTPTENYFASQESAVSENAKLQQIEDRLDNLSRRISSLMDRIDLIEKKVRKLEGN